MLVSEEEHCTGTFLVNSGRSDQSNELVILRISAGFIFRNPFRTSGNSEVFDLWQKAISNEMSHSSRGYRYWLNFSFWGYDGPVEQNVTKIRKCYEYKEKLICNVFISAKDCDLAPERFFSLLVQLTREVSRRMISLAARKGHQVDRARLEHAIDRAEAKCRYSTLLKKSERPPLRRNSPLSSNEIVCLASELFEMLSRCLSAGQLRVSMLLHDSVVGLEESFYSEAVLGSRSLGDHVISAVGSSKQSRLVLLLHQASGDDVALQVEMHNYIENLVIACTVSTYEAAVDESIAQVIAREHELLIRACSSLVYFEGVFPFRATPSAKDSIIQGAKVLLFNGTLAAEQSRRTFKRSDL